MEKDNNTKLEMKRKTGNRKREKEINEQIDRKREKRRSLK
jgi:hypothetical protein